jgi:hypothetical protein
MFAETFPSLTTEKVQGQAGCLLGRALKRAGSRCFVQGWRRDAGDVTQDLALTAQPIIGGLASQFEMFPQCLGRQIFKTFDDFHYTGAAETIPATVGNLIDAFVRLNIIEQRHLAQVGVLTATDLFPRVQEFNRRHNSPSPSPFHGLYTKYPKSLQ